MTQTLSDPTRCLPEAGLRERQRAARNEAILRAAFALIEENGYEAMTLEAVASRVGISRQTLYHHFASKEAIALRAIITLAEQGITSIREIDPALPAIVRLERVVHWMIERCFRPELAAFVRAKASLSLLKQHPDYRAVFERRAEVIVQIVEAAQQDGEIRQDLPPRLVVQMLFGVVGGVEPQEWTTHADVMPAAVADIIAETFLRGIRTKEAL